MRRLTGMALLVLALSSCSIKEDRSECPCILNLDFRDALKLGASGPAVTTISPSLGGYITQESLQMEDYSGVCYETLVPRKTVGASVVAGLTSSVLEADRLVYPHGVGADPVMAFAVSRICGGEKEYVGVQLHKQHSRITFSVVGREAGERMPFDLRVRGNSSAMDLFSLKALDGEFEAMATDGPAGTASIVVPRQKPGFLKLDLIDRTVSSLQYTLDLDAKLREQGFDWEQEDLPDVSVTVDYSRLELSVAILPWDDSDGGSEREI